MPKTYYHELPEPEKTAARMNDTTKEYLQPDWCLMGDALDPAEGCWSLLHSMRNCREDCRGCEFCKNV